MTNKELETKIKDRLKKLSKDEIIELYLQMKFERDYLLQLVYDQKEGDDDK